jgi:uncharacterized protein YndB with AHSA1/START domain
MNAQTDRIEKQIDIKAPRSRVWRALTDTAEFGTWFGIDLDGPFVPGQWTRGRITEPSHAHMTLELRVEQLEPETRFTYRWHPYPADPQVDYSAEPTTLVEFTLEEIPEGTRLHLVESGFDRVPAHRRDEAYRMHEQGWGIQLKDIQAHVMETR